MHGNYTTDQSINNKLDIKMGDRNGKGKKVL